MSGPETLAAHAGILRTRVGACWPGERAVFRGRDLHRELRNSDWLEFYLFGIAGRHFTPQQTKLLHGMWVMTSYPDARIWNNRIAGLAGSARSTPVLGITAALGASEARLYGGGPGLRAIDFFQRAGRSMDDGRTLRDVVVTELESRYIYGFGRPINSRDERLPWLAGLADELGLGGGRYLKLAREVETILVEELERPALRMNYAGMTAALGADLGLTPREFHILRVPLFLGGMPPCWIEAAAKPEGALFPTPCSGVAYEGAEMRRWRK